MARTRETPAKITTPGETRRRAARGLSSKIRRRVIIPLALMVFSLTVVGGLLFLQNEAANFNQSSEKSFTLAEANFHNALANETGTLQALLEVIARDASLRSYFLRRDTKAILKYVRPLFLQLRKQHRVTHFYFLDPQRVCLLRVHKPERSGDLINRFTAIAAEQTGKTASGIELGPMGTFALRVVRPWYKGKQLIGYLELGEEIGHILRQVKATSGLDLVITIHKEFLQRRNWEAGMAMLGRKADWDLIPTSVVIDQTSKNLPAALLRNFPAPGGKYKFENKSFAAANHEYRMAIRVLQDAGNRPIGDIILLKDLSAQIAYRHNFLGIIALVGGGSAMAVIIFFYFFLGRVERKLARQDRALSESEARYRAVFEGAGEGILAADVETAAFKYANSAVCRMFGYSQAEMLALKVSDIHPKEKQPEIMASFQAQARGEVTLANNTPCQRKDGDVFYADIKTNLVELNGRLCNVGFFTDITERKLSEEKILRHQQELADRIKELDCLYSISKLLDKRDTPLDEILQEITSLLPQTLQHPEFGCARVVLAGREYRTKNYKSSPRKNTAVITRAGKEYGKLEVCCLESTLGANAEHCLFRENKMLTEIAKRVGIMIEDKEIEQKLQQSETKFRTLYESTSDAVMLLDETGFIDCNQAAVKLFGCKDKAEFCSQHPADLSPPRQPDGTDSMTAANARIATAMQAGSNHFEWLHRRMTGQDFYADVLLNSMELEGRQVIQAVVRDITERKQAEERLREENAQRRKAEVALRASEMRYRELFDNMSSGVAVYEVRGEGDEFILKEINRAAERIDQIKRRDILGRNVEEVFPGIEKFGLLDVFKRVAATRIPEHMPAGFYEDSQISGWRENYVYPLPGGEIVAVYEDVTKQREAELELEEIHQKLIQASRQAGMAEMATGVLHNIGNALNSVNVSAAFIADKSAKSELTNLGRVIELLREHEHDLAAYLSGDSQGKQILAYLAKLSEQLCVEQAGIQKEAGLLRDNINHIREIVRTQQSYAQSSAFVEKVTVEGLVEDALRINASALKRHRISVIREYQSLEPILVEKHKVVQILVNLIKNAKNALKMVDFNQRQLTLGIAAVEDETVCITVADTGVGIPEENLKKVFAHGFTTSKKGHGFGLHISALSAQDLGGSLTVKSDGPGKGAVFELKFPISPKEKADDTQKSNEEPANPHH